MRFAQASGAMPEHPTSTGASRRIIEIQVAEQRFRALSSS
jgi:hypothetical protein